MILDDVNRKKEKEKRRPNKARRGANAVEKTARTVTAVAKRGPSHENPRVSRTTVYTRYFLIHSFILKKATTSPVFTAGAVVA